MERKEKGGFTLLENLLVASAGGCTYACSLVVLSTVHG
jgi:hypothetical protein